MKLMKKTAAVSAMGAVTLTALVGSLAPASAQATVAYGPDGTRYVVDQRDGYRPLTVNPNRVHANYNAYSGPKAVVTAPVNLAGHLVATPFDLLNHVFPARGDPAQNPLVLIGAPIHFAGAVAQMPFNVIQAPFGGPPVYSY